MLPGYACVAEKNVEHNRNEMENNSKTSIQPRIIRSKNKKRKVYMTSDNVKPTRSSVSMK